MLPHNASIGAPGRMSCVQGSIELPHSISFHRRTEKLAGVTSEMESWSMSGEWSESHAHLLFTHECTSGPVE